MLGSRTLFRCPESLCKQMKRITITLTALCALTLFIGPVASESTLDSTISSSQWITRGLEEISTKRMMADIRELSGPAFNGRQIGTDNDQQSATFVADRFSALRLHRSIAAPPANQTNPLPLREWKQTVPVIAKMIQPDLFVQITDHLLLHIGPDFLPILDSLSADINASIAFAGYGISDPAQGIDDYTGLDVRNKIVLFLHEKPEQYKGTPHRRTKCGLPRRKEPSRISTTTGPSSPIVPRLQYNSSAPYSSVLSGPSRAKNDSSTPRVYAQRLLGFFFRNTILRYGSHNSGPMRPGRGCRP